MLNGRMDVCEIINQVNLVDSWTPKPTAEPVVEGEALIEPAGEGIRGSSKRP